MARENPSGNQIFGLLLVAGGAYLLYEYFFATPSTASATPGTVTGTNTNTSVTAGSGSAINVNSATGATTNAAPTGSYYTYLLQQILSISGVSSAQLYTPIQWAYYHSKVAGTPTSPSSAQLGLDPNTTITAQDYVNAYQAKGLTGLGCPNDRDCLGNLNQTSLIYNALSTRKAGMSVGEFGTPRANRVERSTKVIQ